MMLSDSELLLLFQDELKRQEAFTLLIKKYQQKIYWHIRKMVIDHDDADDVVQDTFIKIWQGLQNFRSDSQLYTWIYRIATNESLNFLQKKRRQNHVPLENQDSLDLLETLESAITQDYISGDEIQIKLQKALLLLPDKQRLVFNMKYFDDMKYEDISEITGTSVGALKASYHLAVKKIEETLNAEN
ncbi:RNA polymerase, sigma-24 subunit, ECF subfamily [Emticicia oligotrophica DSM 17448]|uniref:RNA polymerase sigma factor n=1 Tax=Emticicia oligotrophica (strain DSM 17448 / CIP 109782 / MTCC 6937 / GPTSA100-15) TaxID=929562 RepID=A0ABM5N7C0_EMTOG|nr:sigma-70 family RNA polymerase sigma factor [Emticicia oligotrophica]AFK05375.1 RNA polymerase, sigma-24 subunit, ECF subfamily [Emticicia oligotrophica DSM 17448]